MGPDADAQILIFTRPAAAPSRQPGRTGHPAAGPGPAGVLDEIDQIYDERARRLDITVPPRSATEAVRRHAREAFSAACSEEIRPAMQAFVDGMRTRGGGGLVEEATAGGDDAGTSCITLWLALAGEIVGSPHPGRYPFLRIERDPAGGNVHVTGGDIGPGLGATAGEISGAVDTWDSNSITRDMVNGALLDVLRRAAT